MGTGASSMNFEQLVTMVIEYAVEHKCTIAESINDVEFDGPDGGFGLSREDTIRLLNHFNERAEMLVSLSTVSASGNGSVYCYHYTDDRIMNDDTRIMLEELSA
jgi:hypothetical protein